MKQTIQINFSGFVNSDDLVTRIPPGFSHIGTLIHFDGSGNIQVPLHEGQEISTESAPLSDEEFERLKNQLEKFSNDFDA